MAKSGLKLSTPENIQANCQGANACLDDTEIPVKVQGAPALIEMILTRDAGADFASMLFPWAFA